mmetsp:Transcript_26326/g.39876  ORF Transcript_26326/g.39876 Transcript_26326/m.39876 type:complete len:469 (+) Transcript_26326:54-1460(+)
MQQILLWFLICYRCHLVSADISFFTQSPRGGHYVKPVAVGVIQRAPCQLLTDSSTHRYTAVLDAGPDDTYSSTKSCEINNVNSIETLVITSDILVFVVDPENSWDSKITSQVISGAKRRIDAGYPKQPILVIVPGGYDSSQESLLEGDIFPFEMLQDLVSSTRVIKEDEAAAAYQKLANSLPYNEFITDKETYEMFLNKVYQSLTSKVSNVVFKPSIIPLFNRQSALNPPTQNEYSKKKNKGKIQSRKPELLNENIFKDAKEELSNLQALQEEVWLNPDRVPLLQFGSIADSILLKVCGALKDSSATVRDDVLAQFLGQLRDLYENQLQSWREHFGRKYDDVLEKEDEENWTEEATRITEGFRSAAQHAIPEKCREGQEFFNADFSYVTVLQGLISDMMEATTMRQDAAADDNLLEEEHGNRPVTWYKKLASRVLVIMVNYAQGWLALQGVRRAAAQRDKEMPKFPLF